MAPQANSSYNQQFVTVSRNSEQIKEEIYRTYFLLLGSFEVRLDG